MEERKVYNMHSKRTALKRLIWFGVCIFVLIAAVSITQLYVDYLEVLETGSQFVPIFLKNLITQTVCSLICFVVCFGLVYASILLIRRYLMQSDADHAFLHNGWILFFISFVMALLSSRYIGVSLYEKFLLFQNTVPFHMADPIFGKDLSYYIFQRPFYEMILDGMTGIAGLLIIFSLVLYFILYIKIGERNLNDLFSNKKIMTHLILGVLIFMLLKAIGMRIHAEDYLTGQFIAELTGGGFTVMNILMRFDLVAPFIILIITCIAIFFLFRKKVIAAVVTCASYVVVLILVNITAFAVQTLYVSPNEVMAEAKYIGHNIEFTRFGYNLQDVHEFEYNVSENPSPENVELSKNEIENIRIIDFPATVTATNQLQGIRGYYEIADMDVGLYTINGKKEAVAIGAREINKDKLDESAKNYLNEKFRFTHGFGVTMAKINEVTPKGQPCYLIENLIPESIEGAPLVKQPRIYFGELTKDNVIVNTAVRELDYAEGTKDVEFSYDGDAGVQMTFLNKLLFAFRTGDFRMLIAGQITNDSRLLINRNIQDRIYNVAPFFRYDTDPVLVIDDDGSLKWVIDGYTTSSRLPFSQYTNGYNYIRNAVKVTVDAYTGDVRFYKIVDDDPIANAYQKLYPSLFEAEKLPSSIATKIKYPETLFAVQSRIYAQYHTTDPVIFYNKNDMYAIANEKYSQDIRPVEPYYNIMQLDEMNPEREELVLMMPFTLINRENMVSWLAVGNEGENYGRLIAYKFPKNFTVYGPLQIENMIDNDPEIAKEMTLWNSGGSNVIRGNLLVIPLKNTLLYVEPVYITSDNQASLPLLKRVIVGCGDHIVMEETLEDALTVLFGRLSIHSNDDTPGIPESDEEENIAPSQGDTSADSAIRQVVEAFRAVKNASMTGDWSAFGSSMEKLETAISALSTVTVQ